MNHNYFSISAYLDIPIMAALKDADESQRLCEILLHLKTSIDWFKIVFIVPIFSVQCSRQIL